MFVAFSSVEFVMELPKYTVNTLLGGRRVEMRVFS
jgi:hypothetical protein